MDRQRGYCEDTPFKDGERGVCEHPIYGRGKRAPHLWTGKEGHVEGEKEGKVWEKIRQKSAF